jgi:hypothetical protein
MPLSEGVAKAALYCAHRTSTFLSCAFCEQEGHLAAPAPSFSGSALREHQEFNPLLSTPRWQTWFAFDCAHRTIYMLPPSLLVLFSGMGAE